MKEYSYTSTPPPGPCGLLQGETLHNIILTSLNFTILQARRLFYIKVYMLLLFISSGLVNIRNVSSKL